MAQTMTEKDIHDRGIAYLTIRQQYSRQGSEIGRKGMCPRFLARKYNPRKQGKEGLNEPI